MFSGGRNLRVVSSSEAGGAAGPGRSLWGSWAGGACFNFRRLVSLLAHQQMRFFIFPRSPQSIVEDIQEGKSEHYGSETLREILKLLPDSEEVRNLAPGVLGLQSDDQSFLFFWVWAAPVLRALSFQDQRRHTEKKKVASPIEWARLWSQSVQTALSHNWETRARFWTPVNFRFLTCKWGQWPLTHWFPRWLSPVDAASMLLGTWEPNESQVSFSPS